MSDLVSMQPNININLYIVAPEVRRSRVFEEINRPTFAKLETPLNETCQFISYSTLKDKIEKVTGYIRYLKPEFLEDIAEPCTAF
jgi:hypothetical protein